MTILKLFYRELGEINELTDVLQNQFSSGTYTHHQKSVICDAPGSSEESPRRLIGKKEAPKM